MTARVVVTPTRCSLEGVPSTVLDLIDSRTCYQHDGAAPGGKQYNVVDREHAWDGWVRFLHRPKTIPAWLPAGLRDVALGALREAQVAYEVDDRRVEPEGCGYDQTYAPIPLWDHQEQCVQALLSDYDGVAEMPPRSGKSRAAFEVVRRRALPTIWIAPTTSIVDQTVRAAREFFAAHDAVHVTTANQAEASESMLTVCTAAGMFRLGEKFWASRGMLICDEAHHYLAQKGWGGHLNKVAGHIAHRKGLTGSFFRSGGDTMAMHAFLSRVVYRVSSTELEQRGLLVPCYSAFVRISGPKVRAKKGSGFSGPQGHGILGLAKHAFRNDAVASIAKHLSNVGRTVLILVWTKSQGYEIQKRLEGMFPPAGPTQDVRPVEFVSTDRPKHVVRNVLDSFREHSTVRVLIGTSMIGEGTDLPPADALVYAAGGKAAVQLTQGWYRVITKTEEKQYAVIVDFADCHHKKLKAHSQQRWHTMSTDPIFRMSYCDDLAQFETWCQNLAPWGSP